MKERTIPVAMLTIEDFDLRAREKLRKCVADWLIERRLCSPESALKWADNHFWKKNEQGYPEAQRVITISWRVMEDAILTEEQKRLARSWARRKAELLAWKEKRWAVEQAEAILEGAPAHPSARELHHLLQLLPEVDMSVLVKVLGELGAPTDGVPFVGWLLMHFCFNLGRAWERLYGGRQNAWDKDDDLGLTEAP